MIKHRLEIVEGLHIAHFYDCPITLVEAAAQMAGPQATVENFRPIRPVAGVQGWAALQLQLAPDSEISLRNVRSLCLDISLSNAEFISLSPLWNQRGVYALFTERGPLAFRASNFDDARRYKALQNYGWTLEIAIPDGTSHWGRFVSPNKELINRLAEKAGLSKDEQKAAASGLFPKDYRAGKESLLKILEPWNRTEPPSAAEVESHRKELSTWLENAKSLGWTRKEVYDLFLELLRQKCDPLSDRATDELGEIADRLTGFCPDDFLERFPGDPVDREAFVAYVHRAAWRQPPTMK